MPFSAVISCSSKSTKKFKQYSTIKSTVGIKRNLPYKYRTSKKHRHKTHTRIHIKRKSKYFQSIDCNEHVFFVRSKCTFRFFYNLLDYTLGITQTLKNQHTHCNLSECDFYSLEVKKKQMRKKLKKMNNEHYLHIQMSPLNKIRGKNQHKNA